MERLLAAIFMRTQKCFHCCLIMLNTSSKFLQAVERHLNKSFLLIILLYQSNVSSPLKILPSFFASYKSSFQLFHSNQFHFNFISIYGHLHLPFAFSAFMEVLFLFRISISIEISHLVFSRVCVYFYFARFILKSVLWMMGECKAICVCYFERFAG